MADFSQKPLIRFAWNLKWLVTFVWVHFDTFWPFFQLSNVWLLSVAPIYSSKMEKGRRLLTSPDIRQVQHTSSQHSMTLLYNCCYLDIHVAAGALDISSSSILSLCTSVMLAFSLVISSAYLLFFALCSPTSMSSTDDSFSVPEGKNDFFKCVLAECLKTILHAEHLEIVLAIERQLQLSHFCESGNLHFACQELFTKSQL